MFGRRMLARLLVSALGAVAFHTLMAEEPVGTTPPANSIREWQSKTTDTPTGAAATLPAQSIREWQSTPIATPATTAAPTPTTNAAPAPAADSAGTPAATPAATPIAQAPAAEEPPAAPIAQAPVAREPVGPTPPANSIRAWMAPPSPTPAASPAATPIAQAPVAAPAGPTPLARSIHEWRTTPSPTGGPCLTASPIANVSATPAASAGVPKSPITISITSSLREGTLVIVLDDVPIFNEKFQKPVLLISQTTRWDPLQVAAGKHRLSAKVYGTKKTYLSATYDLDVSRTKASELRFVVQGDKLTVETAS
jgi:hypothetical protein